MNSNEPFDHVFDRYDRTALAAVSAFRNGNDSLGLELFDCSMEDLEQLFELNWCSCTSGKDFSRIVSILQELLNRINHQDMIGMTDLMEFVLCPAVKELAQINGNKDCP
ncbi:hypothetical protein FRZ06_08535 [Anoxybacterium hadale]|uniref:Uncharacterized protein n=1 Tax=Anoxybacterium hadale TaxID=3408580 RepID=A0ACD1AAM8_9FIRM|nr:hypothetical protein FRZ06_08535 [Clostridiales bacterium]